MDSNVHYIVMADLPADIQYEFKVFAGTKTYHPHIFVYKENSPFTPKLLAYIKENFTVANNQPFILVL